MYKMSVAARTMKMDRKEPSFTVWQSEDSSS